MHLYHIWTNQTNRNLNAMLLYILQQYLINYLPNILNIIASRSESYTNLFSSLRYYYLYVNDCMGNKNASLYVEILPGMPYCILYGFLIFL